MTIKPATPLPYAVESGALYQPNTERIYATDPGPELDFSVAFVRDADKATREQNAAYIVTACNEYPRLMAENESMRKSLHLISADRDSLNAERAELVAALRTLSALHGDWEPQGRATKRFCEQNAAAIISARNLLRRIGGE